MRLKVTVKTRLVDMARRSSDDSRGMKPPNGRTTQRRPQQRNTFEIVGRSRGISPIIGPGYWRSRLIGGCSAKYRGISAKNINEHFIKSIMTKISDMSPTN